MSERKVGGRDTCKGCKRAIIWGRTAATGKWMPLDVTSETRMLSFVDGQEFDGLQVVKVYTPHHVTCPDAAKFRRR